MIDYDRMKRVRPKQKAALTRAIKSQNPDMVERTCREAVQEWREIGAWPDDWSRWQMALYDVGSSAVLEMWDY